MTTEAAASVAAWTLGAVFVFSASTKLSGPVAAATAMVNFGVVRAARPIFGVALGVTEMAVGVGLFASALQIRAYLWLAPLVAGGMLVSFALFISLSLLKGRHFSCFCFGDAHDPLSGWTLFRTSALALVALGSGLGMRQPSVAPNLTDVGLELLAAGGIVGTAVLVRSGVDLIRWNRGEVAGHRREE